MKKFISILLCALLLAGSMALTAFAQAPLTYGNEDGTPCEVRYDFENYPDEWSTGNAYVIKSGCTFAVPSGRTLNVPLNSTLTVEEGATFVVNGQLNVVGEMFVYGKLQGTNISGTGSIKCEVRFPSLADENINLKDKLEVRYYIGKESSDYYGDINIDLNDYTIVPADGASIMVDYNKFMYIRVMINEATGEDRFDDKLYPVFYNYTRIDFAQNACPVLVTTSGDVSYGSWPQDESRLYNTYTIILPEGEGYTVYGRNGEFGEVTIKHGQAFSFRVELEEEYNKSDYVVYVYNGTGWTNLEKDDILAGIEPAVPDAEGYYTISSITGNYSIFVEGVLSNEMLDIFSQIFNIFKQVWEAISAIFAEFMSFFQK